MRTTLLVALVAAMVLPAAAEEKRPNIVFAFADDWGKHAGVYGTPVLKTPTFDRLAAEGALFQHAYVAAPSCTPCRNSILTGQWHWRLEQGANLCTPATLAISPCQCG